MTLTVCNYRTQLAQLDADTLEDNRAQLWAVLDFDSSFWNDWFDGCVGRVS